ncbi:hypothetical protein OA408_00430 [Acidimicrobiaceae bacterium]|nr:hypothetical protein [Acidimicrobiaceae bacterium]
MKDYLVILAGSPRGGDDTWNSLYKYVVNHLDADLALCCSDRWNQDTSLFEKADYKWIFSEMNDYYDYYRKNYSGSWKDYFETGRDTGLLSSGSVHFVFKDIILKNYMNILKKYKYIIYTRFDQKHSDYHPKGVKNKILIPEGEDYFGVCDRHALLPIDFCEDFLSICEFINNPKSLENYDRFNNCETTFKKHLESTDLFNSVMRYKRSQFTTSLKGEHTNWRVAKYRLYFYKQLLIKYPDEFMDSIANLINKKGIIYLNLNEPKLLLNYIYLKARETLGNYKKLWLKKK